jgi:hypothetical protein
LLQVPKENRAAGIGNAVARCLPFTTEPNNPCLL